MHKVFLALAAFILGIIAVYFGVNSLAVSSKEFENSHEEYFLSEKPVILFRKVQSGGEKSETEKSFDAKNHRLFYENNETVQCISYDDFNSLRNEYDISERDVSVSRCDYLGNSYVMAATAVCGNYVLKYVPKLAVKIVGYGKDLLITETEEYSYDFLRGILPGEEYSGEIAEYYRDAGIGYFMAYSPDCADQDLVSAKESVLFPFHSEQITDLNTLYSRYSGLKDDELEWRIKGELYRYIEESLLNGYREIYFPSDIRVIRLIERIFEEMGELPVNLVSNCFWSQT